MNRNYNDGAGELVAHLRFHI